MQKRQQSTKMKKVERLPEWRFGIDFGTSNTYVVAYEKTGQIGGESKIILGRFSNAFAPAPSGTSADYNIPTRVTFNADSAQADPTMLIGEEVRKYPILRIFSGLKQAARKLTPPDGKFGEGEAKPREYPFRQCDPETLLQFGTADLPIVHSVHELLVEFFKKILHIGDDVLHVERTTVKKIVIGCPANKQLDRSTSAEYKETLKDILTECFLGKDPMEEEREAFKGNIDVIEEPVLAGETYLYGDGPSEKNVLVIDIGGGTTDFAIVHYGKDTHEAPELEAAISASCETAGNAIDNYIFDLLPNGFPKSKNKCRIAKEKLFKEEKETDQGGNEMVSRGVLGEIPNSERGDLYLISDNNHTGGAKNYISFREGELYLEGELVKKADGGIEEIIYKPIWDKLEAMLTKWQEPPKDELKRKSQDKKIVDTIFFVGGTSIVEPLRMYLTTKVSDFFKISVGEGEGKLKVETLFGENQRKLEVAGDPKPIKITSYNAVAIGACIKAINNGKCAIKPRVEFSWCDVMPLVFDATKNRVVLKLDDQFVPTACVIFSEVAWSRICKNSKHFAQPIQWEVEGKKKSWRIDAENVIKNVDHAGIENFGALVVLSLNRNNAPQCTVYICRWQIPYRGADSGNHRSLREFVNDCDSLADAIKQIKTWESDEWFLINPEEE